MAACTLTLTFAKQGATVQAGEELHGEVLVKVDAPCRCDGLTIAPEWRVSGTGNTATGKAEAVSLFQGEWEAGKHRYPFTCRAPLGPFTYGGQLLKLDWVLVASADIPWAIDPTAEVPFVLVPGPKSDTDAYFFGPSFRPPDPAMTAGISETPGGGKAVTPTTSLPAKILLGAFVLFILGAMATAIPFIAAIIAPFALFFFIKNVMVKNKLGEPDVRLFPNPVRPGEALTLVAQLAPMKEVKLGKVFAELTGEERVVKGSGKNSRTHRHNLHTFVHSFPVEQREVLGGERLELNASIQVPPDAALTFAASSNNIEWQLKLSIELLGWPDWQKTYPVTVRPGAVTRRG